MTILFNRWERELILRHGYPFEDIERQLIESGDSDLVRVTDSPFWWEQVIGNLGISEKEHYEGLAEALRRAEEMDRDPSVCLTHEEFLKAVGRPA